MSGFSSENRLLSIVTPLGKDVLLPTGFSGKESLSRLFVYQIDLLSSREDITAKDLVGKNVTWAVQHSDAKPRFFNGFVSRFAAGGIGLNSMRTYRIEVVPWLWFLTRTSDCKVFYQDKTTPVILAEVFETFGFKDVVDDGNLKGGKYPPREYCVQYRETAFNFVSRLMEDEGIFYTWRHENGKHTLVLCRQKSNYVDCPEKEVRFSSGSLAESATVSAWQHEWEARSGAMAHMDYYFETPPAKPTDMLCNVGTVVDLPPLKGFELYDSPGDFRVRNDGMDRLGIRMEEEETPHDVVTGAGNCSTFFPAGKFKLVEHEIEVEKGKEYVLTSVQHTAHDTNFGPNSGGSSGYQNSFTCIPSAANFRPARITPRPVIHGCQTALVVGPNKDEIHTDKYGRVRVQFHWDRYGGRNEKSSCWIRVGTPWAGKNWGMVHIPRIGQEVIVEFLEGDPDRPLVVGSVYNADNMPPYDLPKHKTQSGVKSRSSLKGTPDNFNEIRFEDLKGQEAITIHAERDLSSTVEHNESHTVFGSQNISVGAENVNAGTKTEKIYGDTKVNITKGNYNFHIETGTSKTEVQGKVEELYHDTQTTTVTNDITIASTAGLIDIGAPKSIQLHVGTSMIWIDPGKIHIKADAIIIEGNNTVDIKPKVITIHGSESVNIQPKLVNIEGSDAVKITKASIHLKGTDVKINGSTITADADGEHIVKGSTVKIN